ncbi:MAG: hypothetical protein EBU90_01985 [Proteobacteria bacterium]|nr:hypothetical protein [Pseudomonadota bacterium]NBP13251.1 hypothetical protein [bacterium]
MHLLNFDVFESLISKVDYETARRLIMVCKKFYGYYRDNKDYFDKLLGQKVLNYFDFNFLAVSESTVFYDKLYKHFKYHRVTAYIDILVYLIESHTSTNNFFKSVMEMCIFRNNVYSIRDTAQDIRRMVSYQDLKYILVYSDMHHTLYILKQFVVPCSVVAFCIKQMLFTRKFSREKVKLLVDHLFVKHCLGSFSEVDNVFNNTIILDLIKHKEIGLVTYYLEKKRMYNSTIAYQIVINELIKRECVELFDTFNQEMEFDSVTRNVLITIDKDVIKLLVEKNSFYTIRAVITHFLHEHINMTMYIKGICDGIGHLRYKGLNYDIAPIEPFLTSASKALIQSAINKKLI